MRAEVGEIDILVQAAGLLRGGPAVDLTEAAWDQVLDVNAKGLFFMMQAVAVQSMIPRETGRDRQLLVDRGHPRHARAALLAALQRQQGRRGADNQAGSRGMGEVRHPRQRGGAWWREHVREPRCGRTTGWRTADRGIRRRCGPAASPADLPPTCSSPIPLKRLVEPWEVAASVAFLASDMAAMITGQVLVIDGGGSVVGY